MQKDCPAILCVCKALDQDTQGSCPGEAASLGQVPVARSTRSATESSYSSIAQLTNPSPQANLIRSGGNTNPSLTPISSIQELHSDPREKADQL